MPMLKTNPHKGGHKVSSAFVGLPPKPNKQDLVGFLIALEPFGRVRAIEKAKLNGTLKPVSILPDFVSQFTQTGSKPLQRIIDEITLALLKLMLVRIPVQLGEGVEVRVKSQQAVYPKNYFALDFKLWDTDDAEIVFKTKSRSAAFAISGVIKVALGGESFQSVIEDSLDNNSAYFAKRLLKDPDINEIREFEACTLGSGMNPDALAYTISKKVA